MRLALIAAALLIALPHYSEARGVEKASVYVASTAEDSVGGRVVYALRETIRRSSIMELVPNSDVARYVIHISTIEPSLSKSAGQALSTAYSVVWTVYPQTGLPVFWTHTVGICGSTRVAECGDGLAAETERVVSEVRAVLSAN